VAPPLLFNDLRFCVFACVLVVVVVVVVLSVVVSGVKRGRESFCRDRLWGDCLCGGGGMRRLGVLGIVLEVSESDVSII
jgi:hypothetical protein